MRGKFPRPASKRRTAPLALAALGGRATITVRYVGSAEGRRLNHAYRDRDNATNVLSFAYGGGGRGEALTGDIVLCAPVLRREARARQDAGRACCASDGARRAAPAGHDHQSAAAAARMEALEKKILARLGLRIPTPAISDLREPMVR